VAGRSTGASSTRWRCPAVFLDRASILWPATVRRIEVDLRGFEVPANAAELVPESLARQDVVVPIGFRGQTLVLAMRDPDDRPMLEVLEFILNRGIEAVAAPAGQIIETINRRYGDGSWLTQSVWQAASA
jgi:hypothetical protein